MDKKVENEIQEEKLDENKEFESNFMNQELLTKKIAKILFDNKDKIFEEEVRDEYELCEKIITLIMEERDKII